MSRACLLSLAALLACARAYEDLVETPAGIAGDENAVVTGELGSPLELHCMAYGYPQPSVSWYRGYENASGMVPSNDAVYNATENILLIRNLAVETLGHYTCHADNGVGMPASWVVVVEAHRPEGINASKICIPRKKVNCGKTKYGCCPDKKTAAKGPFDLGCRKPHTCKDSTYGCCPDGLSPALGDNNEGCPVEPCAETLFGCCLSDNKTAAQGSYQDGCPPPPCASSEFGCCPNNVTIAQGPDNLGCGCQYTQHGCCLDGHTAAFGPNYKGCACNHNHKYQFGCCDDGVNIATGPEQQGCLCSDSKYGCCGDGETHATGPDAAGCDCSSSRHGCCPDGLAVATGPKFRGCTDAPENKQAACGLAMHSSPCHNFTAMWYYDLTYGGCSRFWYGGCGGNGNRFATKKECEQVCVHPSPKDACKLPSVKGACDAEITRWHYNSTQGQCMPFKYGGCLGNDNNFKTSMLCHDQCIPSTVTDQCYQHIDQGPCAGDYWRWGFNKEAHRCEQFIWGGCEGNSNRFKTEAACQKRCLSDQARLQWVEGPWGPCSKTCGTGGTKYREVTCQKINANGLEESIVADHECFDQLGPEPGQYQHCDADVPCPTWFIGHWKPCDKLCDEGTQSRQVVCHQKIDGHIEVLDDWACRWIPIVTEELQCMLQPCDGVDWVTSDWLGCDTCDSKIRTRSVVCTTKNWQVLDDSFCSYHSRPADQELCDKVPTCGVQWYATLWSKCSVNCGEGVQTRKVFCGMFKDDSVEVVDDAKCADLPKYKETRNETKPCTVPKEECPSQWFAGPWSECSKPCGGGEHIRTVMCLRGDKEDSGCDPNAVLELTQLCNTGPCDPDDLLAVNQSSIVVKDDEEYCEDEDYKEIGQDSDLTTTTSGLSNTTVLL